MTCDEIFEKCKTPEECKNAMAALLENGDDEREIKRVYKKRMLGLEIRKKRMEKKISLVALADQTGVTTQTICRLEKGRVKRPTRATIELLCEALGIGKGQEA